MAKIRNVQASRGAGLGKHRQKFRERNYKRDWRRYLPLQIPSKPALPTYLYDILRKAGVRKILDYGCGAGKFSTDFYRRGYDVVGVDINPTAIKFAKTEAKRVVDPKASNKLVFHVEDVTRAKLKEAPFDAVAMQLLISTVGNKRNRAATIETARGMLKKGGILYLSASGLSGDINPKYQATYKNNYPVTKEWGTYASKDEQGRVLYWTHHFSEPELKKLLKGFEITVFRKERETSSRRKGEAAYFFYIVARKK